MSEITEEIRGHIRQWVGEGCSISEVQARLKSECGVTMTYMDVRFLILDVGVDVQERRAADASTLTKDSRSDESAAQSDGFPDESPPSESAPFSEENIGVTVKISRVARPGKLISGSVRFNDGVTADWSLDSFGQLALAPPQDRPDYRPSDNDIRAFQTELRRLMETRGF